MLGLQLGIEKVDHHDPPVDAHARVVRADLLRHAPSACVAVRCQQDQAIVLSGAFPYLFDDRLGRCVGHQYAKIAPCAGLRAESGDQRMALHPAMRVQVLYLDGMLAADALAPQLVVQPRVGAGYLAFHEYVADDSVHEGRMDAVSAPVPYVDMGSEPEVSPEDALFRFFE